MRKEQIITTNNNQMEEKGMKSRFIHFKKRFVPIFKKKAYKIRYEK